MKLNQTTLSALLLVLSLAAAVAQTNSLQLVPMPAGPFKPDDASLKQYQCPEWFRDAKLGIWAVWGPESVPMQGDWYARRLYQHDSTTRTGNPGPDADNKYHLEHYGHPVTSRLQGHHSTVEGRKVGPGPLDGALQKAGAKYFCMIADAPRQLRLLEFEVPAMELREHGAASATSPANGSRRRTSTACALA